MGVSDKSLIIIVVRKVIGKHNQYRIIQAKVQNLQKKVNAIKAKFKELFKMGLPSFWDTHGNLISQQIYLELLSSQRNDDSKYSNMDKPLIGQILIEKIIDDFNIFS